MREAHPDRDLALESLDRSVVLDPVRPDDLHRDIAEEAAVPGAVSLVARAEAERVDHHQRAVDLLTALQVPARIGVRARRRGLGLGVFDHRFARLHGGCPGRNAQK